MGTCLVLDDLDRSKMHWSGFFLLQNPFNLWVYRVVLSWGDWGSGVGRGIPQEVRCPGLFEVTSDQQGQAIQVALPGDRVFAHLSAIVTIPPFHVFLKPFTQFSPPRGSGDGSSWDCGLQTYFFLLFNSTHNTLIFPVHGLQDSQRTSLVVQWPRL